MPKMRFDHIAMLVHDLDAAVEKWRTMLEVLDPEQAGDVVYGEGTENGEKMRWATFVKPGGTAIQLFAPAGEDGFLRKILAKRGEMVHHVAFLSSDVDATVQELRDRGPADPAGRADRPGHVSVAALELRAQRLRRRRARRGGPALPGQGGRLGAGGGGSAVTLSAAELAATVPDGATVALGGAGLQRKPMALVRALAEAGRQRLRVVSFLGSLDVELLLAAGCVGELHAAGVGLDGAGLAPRYRAARQTGSPRFVEWSEGLLLWALQAASFGVPSLPAWMGVGSDLPEINPWLRPASDPFTGEQVMQVKALPIDVALLHVATVDERGNAHVAGDLAADALIARAAQRTFVSCEEITAAPAEQAALGRTWIDAVVEAPGGAWPCGCHPAYGADLAVTSRWAREGGKAGVGAARPRRRGCAMSVGDLLTAALAREIADSGIRVFAVTSPATVAAALAARELGAPRLAIAGGFTALDATPVPAVTRGEAGLFSEGPAARDWVTDTFSLLARGRVGVATAPAQLDAQGRTNLSGIGARRPPEGGATRSARAARQQPLTFARVVPLPGPFAAPARRTGRRSLWRSTAAGRGAASAHARGLFRARAHRLVGAVADARRRRAGRSGSGAGDHAARRRAGRRGAGRRGARGGARLRPRRTSIDRVRLGRRGG